jgi:hypothetical protein
MRSARSTYSCSSLRRRFRLGDRGAAVLLVGALLVTALASCSAAPRQAAAAGPRTLPADSAALLAAALRQARPAYATQEEALRAGVYAHAAPARPVVPPIAGAGTAGTLGDPRGKVYVIQIGAYRDRGVAESAASDAGQRFPELSVVIQTAGEYYRIALAGWPEPGTARDALRVVRPYYPDAWLRRMVP